MSNFTEVSIAVENEFVIEILIAELSEIGFSGFEEDRKELKAFVNEEELNEEELEKILKKYDLNYLKSTIVNRNWNEIWESSFSPVQVDNFCLIRADFHSPSSDVMHDIIITPKMSFGTGHHATTYLMVQQMQHIKLKNKRVADFGTGTGILSILAEKLGSKYILAIDNDEWSINNAKENFERNKCSNIELKQASSFQTSETFDLILANINLNVILENFNGLVFGLNECGNLLLSGLLKKDENEILVVASRHNLEHLNTVERDEWISVLFATATATKEC